IGRDNASGRDVITVKVNPKGAKNLRDVHLVIRRTKKIGGSQTDVNEKGEKAGPNDPKGDSVKDNYPENSATEPKNRTAPDGWGNQLHTQTENGVTTDYVSWAIPDPSELGKEGEFTVQHKGPTDPKFYRTVKLTTKGKVKKGAYWFYDFQPADVIKCKWIDPDKWPASSVKSELGPLKSVLPGPGLRADLPAAKKRFLEEGRPPPN
ncbi:MAG: hypothetical protein WC485_12825, partial [Opitutaceae bacterium]